MCLTSTFSDSALSGSAPHRRLTHCIIDQHVTLHTWTVHRLFVHCHCNTSLQCTPVHLTCIFDQRTASLYTVTAIPNCSAPQYIYSAPQCNYSALNYSASHRAPHNALHSTLHSALHIAHNTCIPYSIPVHLTTSATTVHLTTVHPTVHLTVHFTEHFTVHFTLHIIHVCNIVYQYT